VSLRASRIDRTVPLTPEQLDARERWQAIWNLPILLAAFVPLFVTSPKAEAVAITVGVGSWLIFLADLVVQRRIAPDYLRRRQGQFDLAIVLITFPYYLIPGIGSATAILTLARLGRVVRVVLATKGLRRLAARLGKVAIVAGLMLTIGSLAAYQAEHATNPGFATVGDAFWWGIVTLTTVGYGDIVPHTTAGRVAGVAIMLTGVAVLGVLAGSLAALFHLDASADETPAAATDGPRPVHEEMAALRSDLQALEERLGALAERARTEAGDLTAR
jgi:voltage-gated potassium channel